MGQTTCPYCGDEMSHPRRVQCGKPECHRRYQNDRCRKWSRENRDRTYDYGRTIYQRECCVCGDTFTTRRKDGRYCGDGPFCEKNRKPPKIVRGPRCRISDRPKPRTWIEGPCPECGERIARPTRAQAVGFCSRRCARRDERRRYRARRAGSGVRTLTFRTIAERDNWTCQLCGESVDHRLTVPELLAPTLDHIIPLALGDTHTEDNAQLAHFICNSMKSDGRRVAVGEQTQMV